MHCCDYPSYCPPVQPPLTLLFCPPYLLYHRSVYGQVGMYRDDIEEDDFMVIMDSVAAYARSMVRLD